MKRLSSDQGNALLEGVGFAAIAFGLLMTLGLNVLTLERDELTLMSIARNSMRAFLLQDSEDLESAVAMFQEQTTLANDALDVRVRCERQDCRTRGNLIWLEIHSDDLVASAFGVIGE